MTSLLAAVCVLGAGALVTCGVAIGYLVVFRRRRLPFCVSLEAAAVPHEVLEQSEAVRWGQHCSCTRSCWALSVALAASFILLCCLGTIGGYFPVLACEPKRDGDGDPQLNCLGPALWWGLAFLAVMVVGGAALITLVVLTAVFFACGAAADKALQRAGEGSALLGCKLESPVSCAGMAPPFQSGHPAAEQAVAAPAKLPA
jgi:predicted anti-sigma-YlaC factor YlaD